jgi:trk system potassium uptake protein TrkH
MRLRVILQFVGFVVLLISLSMLLAVPFSLAYEDGTADLFFACSGLGTAAGGLLVLATRSRQTIILNHREGMAIVTLSWIAAGVTAALPFYVSGAIPSFTDCLFETMSGFTTTGASILDNIEGLPHGLLFWRSLTHWLGGMGIILLSLAVLPFLGVGGMQLYKAEVPGPTPDKLRPRIKDTALILWTVYLLFTVLETILLYAGGMDVFNALCHTFGTVATGGFSPKNASIGHYSSVYIHVVITVFMFLAGTNFALHYKLLQGSPGSYLKSSEFKYYLALILLVIAVLTLSVGSSTGEGAGYSLRHGAFQAVSILTTTGYVTADYELWAPLAQVLLLICMFSGGMAGSTSGGIKTMRTLLLAKHNFRELKKLVHPRAVIPLKLDGRPVPENVLGGIWGFFLLFLLLMILAALVLAGLGVDPLTSFAAAIACIGNIGPGLGGVGPADNYAGLPLAAKWVLTFCMLLGRLEIYTVIILITPDFWRK